MAFLRKVGQIGVPQTTTVEIISFTDTGKAAEVGTASVTDRQLVHQSRGGDREAMETLFQRHEIAVFRFALRVLHCADDADDVRQETFVRVFSTLARFREDASFKTYALAICANLCRDRLRAGKRRPESLYGLAPGEYAGDSSSDPARGVERDGDRDRVRAVIASLPPLHRETLHLRYVEELSVEEIARVAGCSRLAVPVRLFRARKAFEKAFRAYANLENGN